MNRISHALQLPSLSVSLLFAGIGSAAYPERPITFIVPGRRAAAPMPPRGSSARCSKRNWASPSTS